MENDILRRSKNDNADVFASDSKYVIAPSKIGCEGDVVNGINNRIDRLGFRPPVGILIILKEKDFPAGIRIRIVTPDSQPKAVSVFRTLPFIMKKIKLKINTTWVDGAWRRRDSTRGRKLAS